MNKVIKLRRNGNVSNKSFRFVAISSRRVCCRKAEYLGFLNGKQCKFNVKRAVFLVKKHGVTITKKALNRLLHHKIDIKKEISEK